MLTGMIWLIGSGLIPKIENPSCMLMLNVPRVHALLVFSGYSTDTDTV